MQTCKDCVHYAVCVARTHENTLCDHFKNKSDFQEVKYGKWKKHTDDGDCDYIECSACGEEFYPPNNEFTFDVIPKYCQNCGAKMDGGKSE